MYTGENLGRAAAPSCCVHADPSHPEPQPMWHQAPWPFSVPARTLVLLSPGLVPSWPLFSSRRARLPPESQAWWCSELPRASVSPEETDSS